MKTKTLITLSLLWLLNLTAKAQNLTLEQTVDYINGIIKTDRTLYGGIDAYNNSYVNEAKVEKSGRITFYYNNYETKASYPKGSFNVFDLVNAQWDADEGLKTRLHLKAKDNVEIGWVSGLSKLDGDKLFKAIWHLKDVCTKSLDPFGN